MQLDRRYRTMKLEKFGFSDAMIAAAEERLAQVPLTEFLSLDPLPVLFQDVKMLPVTTITGLPADCKPREVRLLVSQMKGYKGMGTRIHNGTPLVYVWWMTTGNASKARARLLIARIDPACPCALDVQVHIMWSGSKQPPPIYL